MIRELHHLPDKTQCAVMTMSLAHKPYARPFPCKSGYVKEFIDKGQIAFACALDKMHIPLCCKANVSKALMHNRASHYYAFEPMSSIANGIVSFKARSQ